MIRLMVPCNYCVTCYSSGPVECVLLPCSGPVKGVTIMFWVGGSVTIMIWAGGSVTIMFWACGSVTIMFWAGGGVTILFWASGGSYCHVLG